MCLLEKYFPPSFFDIMIHLTVHLVKEVRLCEPIYLRWMYPFERFMKVLKSYVLNCNRLEGSIVECYIAEEAIEFYTKYLSNVDTIGVPIDPRIDHKIETPLPRSFVMKVDPIVCCKHIIMCWRIQLLCNLILSKDHPFVFYSIIFYKFTILNKSYM